MYVCTYVCVCTFGGHTYIGLGIHNICSTYTYMYVNYYTHSLIYDISMMKNIALYGIQYMHMLNNKHCIILKQLNMPGYESHIRIYKYIIK